MKKTYLTIFISILAIFFFLWENSFIYPLRLFLTLIHESFHGLTTLLTGGNIVSVDLDGVNGKILSSGGFYPLISISGYLGSSLLGAFLISSKYRNIIISTILIYVLFILIAYTKFSFEFFIILGFSLFIFYLIFKGIAVDIIGFVVGSFLIVSSFEDIRNYLFSIPSQTDSGLLANYFGMPFLTLPISLFMGITSLIFVYFGMKSFFKT